MRTRNVIAASLVAGVGFSLQAVPAAAFEFNLGPSIEGNVSTELVWGAQWSTEDADERYMYSTNGGTNPSPNEDNGRLNYNTGLISNQIKGRTEVGLMFGGLGSDIMGTVTKVLYFYDFFEKDHSRRRTQNSNERDNEIGADVRILENYGYWEGLVADEYPLVVRLGDQVINWGEANFIAGTNSFVNPLDYNRILSSTFDTEELYDPIGAIFASFGVSADLAIDAYIQYDWKPARIPPGGSFFGSTDYVGAGVKDSGDGYICLDGVAGADSPPFSMSPLGTGPNLGCGFLNDDEDASQHGQYGLRASFYLAELNNTNLSVYYFKYHNRLPHVGIPAAGGVPGLFIPGATGTVAFGPFPAIGAISQVQVANGFGEDIEVWGTSFNTSILDGYSWSGEATLRKDYPLQIHTTELVCASAYIDGLAVPPASGGPFGAGGVAVPLGVTPQCAGANLPIAAPGTRVDGFDRQDVLQLQTTFAKTFPQMLGGNNLLALLEIGYQKVLDMPGPDELRYEADDVGESGFGYHADDAGWGYRLLLTNEYTRFSSIFQNVNMAVKPMILFAHDVNGNTVKNLASYKEGAKLLITGVTLDYQNQYALTLRYNTSFGAKDRNMFADRDHITLSVSADF